MYSHYNQHAIKKTRDVLLIVKFKFRRRWNLASFIPKYVYYYLSSIKYAYVWTTIAFLFIDKFVNFGFIVFLFALFYPFYTDCVHNNNFLIRRTKMNFSRKNILSLRRISLQCSKKKCSFIAADTQNIYHRFDLIAVDQMFFLSVSFLKQFW